MKILFCNYEYPPLGGGGGVVNAALAEELARRHEVVVLTSRAFDLPADAVERGVRVIRVPVMLRRHHATASIPSMLTYLPTGIRHGNRLLRQERFDVINTHFVLPTGPVGHSLARRFRIPNVLSVHGGDLYDPSKPISPHKHAVLRAIVRRLARAADAVVAQSDDTLSNLHRFFAPGLKSTVIPLGISRPPATAGSRDRYGFADSDVLFITVGRLVARKAVDQLIESIAAVDDDRVKLIVVGAGPFKEALMGQVRRAGIAARVRFVGLVDEATKLELLSIADVFASTSQHEGFGLVFLEAMAFGLPVICYNRGGQIDFLESGRSGYVVDLNDHAAYTARVRELANSREARENMGRDNLQRVQEYFIDRCADQYERLFEDVIRRSAE